MILDGMCKNVGIFFVWWCEKSCFTYRFKNLIKYNFQSSPSCNSIEKSDRNMWNKIMFIMLYFMVLNIVFAINLWSLLNTYYISYKKIIFFCWKPCLLNNIKKHFQMFENVLVQQYPIFVMSLTIIFCQTFLCQTFSHGGGLGGGFKNLTD